MYEAISKSILNSVDSFIVYKSLDWDSSELLKRLGCYQVPKLARESWNPHRILLVDNYEDLSWGEKRKLGPYLYDADRVIYLKNPFYEGQEVEEIFQKSKKSYFSLNLFRLKPGLKVRFIKLGLFSPRLRLVLFSLIFRLIRKNHLCLKADRTNKAELFQFLAQGAKRRRNCYILGMSKPKVLK